MSDAVNSFRLALKDFATVTVPEDVRELRDDIARTAHRVVVLGTPAKSGDTRGNVRLSAGDVPNTTHDGTIRDPSGQGTLAAGEAALANAPDPYTRVWITGNSFVFRFLNNGTRKLVGRHMIEQAVAAVEQRYP